MSSNDPTPHPEDLPWNDAPDDDDIIPGAIEPDPAEVVGDESDARDLAAHEASDPNIRETLDDRLAEEEPDRSADEAASDRIQLIDGEAGEEGVELAEPDQQDPEADDELSAEEAAVHIRTEDRL